MPTSGADDRPSAPSRAPALLSRLPIRVRLTLIFAAAMVFVLAISGVVVFQRVRTEVDARLDLDVSRQAASVLARAERSPSGLAQAVAHPSRRGHAGFAQVLDSRGRIIAATPGLDRVALLSGRELQTALHRRVKSDRKKKDPLPDGARLLSTPIQVPGHGNAVLVVGASLDQRSASLSSLALALGVVGPIALLVAVLAGYRLTAATLKPVELMRRQAATVSASEPGVRLPLPPADDEIHELGSTLNEMLGRLEESFAREQAFVANASHELRTPLSTLRVELDLALRRPRPSEELVDALRSAQIEVERLSDLADDLLELARADDGRLPVVAAETNVADIFMAVRDRFDGSGERVRLAPGADRPITADPRRLEQALGNLVDNALRYGDGQVLLAVEGNGSGPIELHVRDGGPGFPPGFLDQAFERFSRADPSRAGRGAGLGLPIVRMIARAHGGDAHAVNQEGGGADVWLVIAGSPGG
jgi:two-component system, OmpR family, sensor kinase